MPIVSIWLIRAALVHFLAGIALGAVILRQPLVPLQIAGGGANIVGVDD